ncbi:uncharacterized protein PAC_15874 [Phialocephala subalpina]|uniref:Uncharacterized protein n=1 Tax=Phialocephala subalpina TaxID=576137 RepID=A0A1L7XLU1_9HELO|nr:uncharacterized protein PAC_15874 [Phialocephala subalpina]
MSALEEALEEVNVDRVLEILESNPGLSQDELDNTLFEAVSSEGLEAAITPSLIHGAKITQRTFLGATRRQDVVAFQAFLDHGWDINSVEFDQPALRLVTRTETVLKWFLDHGADPNLRDKIDCSPLATAALKPPTVAIRAFEILIDHGAEVDSRALFYSMDPRGKGGIPVMKYLIARGVDVNAIGSMVGSREGTPLHYAVALKSEEKINLLLDAGADKTIKTSYGMTPADVAKSRGYMEIFEFLSRG